MQVTLHKNARTTPAIRQELRESTKSERELARTYHLNRATVHKWLRRETGLDASHRPHRIHATLRLVEDLVVVELLDDLLAVTREFINRDVSRSGMDRCLSRHGVSNLKALIPQPEDGKPEKKTFKDDDPEFVHVDVKYLPRMPGETKNRYLFAAIDRASCWVYVEILDEKTAKHAAGFLECLIEKAPFKIQKVLTDHGIVDPKNQTAT